MKTEIGGFIIPAEDTGWFILIILPVMVVLLRITIIREAVLGQTQTELKLVRQAVFLSLHISLPQNQILLESEVQEVQNLPEKSLVPDPVLVLLVLNFCDIWKE